MNGDRQKIRAYCVMCKEKLDMKDPEMIAIPTKAGGTRPAMRGVCPVCGTRMFKVLPVGDDDQKDTFQPTKREMENWLTDEIVQECRTSGWSLGDLLDEVFGQEVERALAAQRMEHEADIRRRREAIEKGLTKNPVHLFEIEENKIIRCCLSAFDSPDRKGE